MLCDEVVRRDVIRGTPSKLEQAIALAGESERHWERIRGRQSQVSFGSLGWRKRSKVKRDPGRKGRRGTRGKQLENWEKEATHPEDELAPEVWALLIHLEEILPNLLDVWPRGSLVMRLSDQVLWLFQRRVRGTKRGASGRSRKCPRAALQGVKIREAPVRSMNKDVWASRSFFRRLCPAKVFAVWKAGLR